MKCLVVLALRLSALRVDGSRQDDNIFQAKCELLFWRKLSESSALCSSICLIECLVMLALRLSALRVDGSRQDDNVFQAKLGCYVAF